MNQETKQFPGKTYKLRAPGVSEHAAYFTIAGDPPEMFFFNSKEMESFQWITGKMTDMSRLLEEGKLLEDNGLRKPGLSLEKVIDDMKETFQPGGDYIIPDGTGRKVNSVVHHLGLILEQHIRG